MTVLQKLFLLSLGSCTLFPQPSEPPSEAEGLFCPEGTRSEGEKLGFDSSWLWGRGGTEPRSGAAQVTWG